ncbi:PREDICTED: serine proteinase stubble [Nicrophorus vespilloides]|uniref:Serine proteinase stubble n=1 Tax=Nicrophorus vespilloides TaxID=110193 RepID=A0ABM1NIA8_NICVS|nr:PREDICTED: serine proteinase stubble [Nicrophorus vespilloides]
MWLYHWAKVTVTATSPTSVGYPSRDRDSQLFSSTGRNIRNLPCVSRKSNLSGVCMFAIDCLKANGTHLGTCIDRFYFGSCCHIDPIDELDIIPSREPPHRTSSSTTSPSTVTITTTTKAKPQLTELTLIAKVTEATPFKTTNPYSLQTFQSVENNEITTTLKPFPVTKRPTSKPVKPVTVKPKPKPSTKPSLNITVITRPTRPRVTTKPTKITKPTTIKPIKTTTSKKIITTTTPTPTTIITTRKPITTTTATKKPVVVTTTKTPIIITTTKKPLVTTTKKPVTTTTTTTQKTTTTRKTTKKPITTIKTTTEPQTTTRATTTTVKPEVSPQATTATASTTETLVKVPVVQDELQTATATTTMKTTTMESSNELPVDVNATSLLESVNGNPATNEIESVKPAITAETEGTTSSNLITWAEINANTTIVTTTTVPTTAPTTTSSILNATTEPEDWVPITNGWVLLTEPSKDATTATTQKEAASTMTSTMPSTLSASTTTTTGAATETASTSSSVESVVTSMSSEVNSLGSEGSTMDTITETTSSDQSLNMSDFTDVCGRRMFPEARIVGGEKSPFGKWPWQISLRQWRTSTYLHKCGAALLNENWAITAAHCVDNVPPSDLLLRLGEHDLSADTEPYLHEERRVQIVASHPQFDPRTFEYDLALLRFYQPVKFQPNILPVCVPQDDEHFVGKTAYVTGWGRLYEDGPLPSVLQEVSVPVINNTVCESMYRSAGYIEHIPDIFICAGWRRGGYDSCEGDSGGPMVIQRPDKRFLLAGVISWGIGCAEPNQPGVYTRISEFREWINQILKF